ncbi:MAG: hypothetical protein JOZ43_05680 [Acidobacteriales bacterium]|nr:hypothetical protein [Terriglobales bacterium]
MKRKLIIVLAYILVFYAADTLFALRARKSVTVNTTYIVPQKSGRVEYSPPVTETESCVRSLLPHFHHSPCWYATRHTDRQVPIDTGSPVNNPH